MPSRHYWHRHCSLAVRLVDHSWWVFDPTGVQFGPDWPVLSPYDEYHIRARQRPGYDPQNIIFCQFLGTSLDHRQVAEQQAVAS